MRVPLRVKEQLERPQVEAPKGDKLVLGPQGTQDRLPRLGRKGSRLAEETGSQKDFVLVLFGWVDPTCDEVVKDSHEHKSLRGDEIRLFLVD